MQEEGNSTTLFLLWFLLPAPPTQRTESCTQPKPNVPPPSSGLPLYCKITPSSSCRETTSHACPCWYFQVFSLCKIILLHSWGFVMGKPFYPGHWLLVLVSFSLSQLLSKGKFSLGSPFSSAPQTNQPLPPQQLRDKGLGNALQAEPLARGTTKPRAHRVWQLLCQPRSVADPARVPCLRLTHFQSDCLPSSLC